MGEINKRKIAFREEALNLLGDLDHVPNEEDVRTAYKLDCFECALHDESLAHPKPQNCRDNPYCINRLGLEKFSKLLKVEEQNADKIEKNLKRRNIHEVPCGLTNTGNFCYVNSFLQVFFNDPRFRQIIYKWSSSPDFIKPAPPKMDVQAVMNSMQRVFYTLEYTPFEDTSTFDFTEVLRLGNLQQDAQEFTLMFLSALERNLPSHPFGKPILDFLRRRFYGKTSTRTWCECGGRDNQEVQPFMSLQLPIEGHNTLPKAIERHFDTEKLLECRCEACGRQDKVCRKTEIVELPEILIIQLNRYINDMVKMCQRKLRSPLAYPRTLKAKFLKPSLPEDEDHEYELFAVMIHEGDNTHCGHYYDLIKHPYIDKWFKYNDEVVEALQKPPGYDKMARGFSAAKASNDMKTCYGLIYRKKEQMNACEPPEQQICEPWREEFDAKFANNAGHEIKKCSHRVKEITTRFTDLNNVFSNLKAHTDRYKNTKSLAFVPLELLTDILEKECEYAKKQLKEMENDENDVEPASKRLPEGMTSPNKRREKFGKVSREEIAVMLKTTVMKLCPHGLVRMESVLYGDVKIVSRVSAEHLLSRYNFTLKKESSGSEEAGTLFTGADLCLLCAKLMQDEAHLKRRLDATSKVVAKILREKHRDSLSKKEKPAGHFYVSKKTLSNFNKLAEQQFRFTNWLDDNITLKFLPGSKQAMASNVLPSSNGITRSRKRRYQKEGSIERNENDLCKIHPDLPNYDITSVLEDMITEVCKDASNLKVNGQHKEIETEKAANEEREDCDIQESRPATPMASKPEEVVFNYNLSCEHGKPNIPEFRYAVSPEEWNELTSYFPSFFEVKCSDNVCDACIRLEAERRNEADLRGQQKKALKQEFGNFIRIVEKRLPESKEIGKEYKYGVCSVFVNAVKVAFRRTLDNFELPNFCQKCVLCESHDKPYRELITTIPFSQDDPRIVPITEKEWNTLIAQWPNERADEMVPIFLDEQNGIKNFCHPCFDNIMQLEKLNRMTFEDQYVYVKVETADAPPEAKVELGKRGPRRGNQKNVYKFLMSHTDTVKDLKVKLYGKIHQTPLDQTLYNDDVVVENEQTLYDAMVEPNNIDKPLKVIVQTVHPSPTKFLDEDREPEMGFTGTALTF